MKNIFNRKISQLFKKNSIPKKHISKIPYFYEANENTPEKHKEWNICLRKNKDVVARPPINVNFIGTKLGKTSDENTITEKVKTIYTKKQKEVQAQLNEKTFDKAVFILSQSSTGRDLLENLNKAGYEILFDEERTSPVGAGGLCDPTNKQIILSGSSDPYYMALVLGHEAVHAMQYSTNNIFPNSSYAPEAIIQISFIIEADAYAQQTQIALELAYGDPEGPKNQFKTKKTLGQMRKRFKNIVDSAEKTLIKKENLTNGSAVTAAFEGFFDNIVLRSFYEDNHTEWCNAVAKEFSKNPERLNKSFGKPVNIEDIKNNIKHKNQPYLKQHAPNMDITNARYAGVTSETIEKLTNFYKQYKPNNPMPKLKTYGVHVQNAAAFMFGRDADTNIVILKKPPINNHKPKP